MTTNPLTGGNPDFVPTNPRGLPAQTPPRRRGRAGVVLAGIAGVVVGGLLVGGAWLIFGGSGGGTSSAPLAAPERVGDYARYPDVAAGLDRGKRVADRFRDWDARSSDRLAAAHDGAGAFVQTYTDENLEESFTVEAVRAPSPYPPYAAYSDPETLGTERPTEELREFGDVGCLVHNNPSQSYVMTCLRTDEDLTVRITHASGDLLEDPDAVAALVDAAWRELT